MSDPRALVAALITVEPQSERNSLGLLLLRIIVGLAFAFHGFPKMLHPTAWMGAHAFVPPWMQAIVAFVEFAGGIALILGVATSLAAFLILCDMIVAMFVVEIPRGAPFVGHGHSFEAGMTYLVVMLLLLLTGPGALSVDAWLFSASSSSSRRSNRNRLSNAM